MVSEGRQDPDELLRAIGGEEDAARSGRGHLKIFFGYAAGVGKTYAMLLAAHAAARRGTDVVVGYVEPHAARPETTELVRGLEQVPPRRVAVGGAELPELDLDGVLARAPQLVVVDELAHTDAPGSRHTKRYQDVEEILKAGIDVYTTVNVQHIESLNDIVASITGVIVRERIPDRVFDDADQVELVDIEPADLLDRLKAGKIYRPEQARRAMDHFFTVENLTALREIALRRCADRVNRLSDEARIRSNRDYRTSEHILVCLSPSPSNPKIVRTAARMAAAYRGPLTALHIEVPDDADMDDADRARLRENTELAEQLGAVVEVVAGDDVAAQIAEFARVWGISKVVIGRSGARRSPFRKPLTDRLIEMAPGLELYVIPDTPSQTVRAAAGRRRALLGGIRRQLNLRDACVCAALLAVATAMGFALFSAGIDDSAIISGYILAVLVCAILTSSPLYAIAGSVLGVALFNYCFVVPRFTLAWLDPDYNATFLFMFLAALVSSSVTSRLSAHARQSARTAWRTRVLFDTERMLQGARGEERIRAVTAEQLVKLLDRDVVIYPEGEGRLGDPVVFGRDGACPVGDEVIGQNERAVAAWVLKNSKRAGATTDTLPEAACLYYAIRIDDRVFGVVGVRLGGRPLDPLEESILLSILGESALAIEGERASRERERAAVLAKNEQLRANLLRSIGHDLRTPLTSISASADVLLRDPGLSAARSRELVGNIHEDALWLIGLVENLLSVTRIEDGTAKVASVPELVEDVVAEAVRHVPAQARDRVRVKMPDDPLVARMDAGLVEQVVANLVDNALKYSPAGSPVTVSARRDGPWARVSVTDEGPGIPDADKARVFDLFYTVRGTEPVDGRRSLGLGLALCKTAVEACGGTISVEDARPTGSTFSFTLPAEEDEPHA